MKRKDFAFVKGEKLSPNLNGDYASRITTI